MRSSHPSQPEIFISNQASAFSVNLFAALAFTQEAEYQFDVAICPSHDDRSSDSRKNNSYEYRNSCASCEGQTSWASTLQKMRSSHPSQPEIFISNQASAFSVNLFAALAFTQEAEYQFDVAICPSHDDRSSDSRKNNSYEYRNSLFPSSR